jgi:hypothetical protein
MKFIATQKVRQLIFSSPIFWLDPGYGIAKNPVFAPLRPTDCQIPVGKLVQQIQLIVRYLYGLLDELFSICRSCCRLQLCP